MVSEANGEDFVLLLHHGVKKFLDVFVMALEEFALTITYIDYEAQGEREVIFFAEECRLLRQGGFGNGEVFALEAFYECAVRTTHAEGEIDQMRFCAEDGGLRLLRGYRYGA